MLINLDSKAEKIRHAFAYEKTSKNHYQDFLIYLRQLKLKLKIDISKI